MDPDATLAELRQMVAEEVDTSGEWTVTIANERCDRYAELIDALDGWLVKGGALPHNWLP